MPFLSKTNLSEITTILKSESKSDERTSSFPDWAIYHITLIHSIQQITWKLTVAAQFPQLSVATCPPPRRLALVWVQSKPTRSGVLAQIVAFMWLVFVAAIALNCSVAATTDHFAICYPLLVPALLEFGYLHSLPGLSCSICSLEFLMW